MIENRGIWTDFIGGVGAKVSEVFDQGQEEYVSGIGNLLQVEGNVDGAQMTFGGKTGAGKVVEFNEGDDIPLARRYKSYNTTVAWNNYGLGIEVTKNMIEDNIFQAQLDEMKDLSVSVGYSQDESGIQLFNGGFGTATTVNGYKISFYGDGVPTFSTKHPTTVPGASSQSNASSTGIPFGMDNLETGLIALMHQKTDDGMAMMLLGKATVVLPTALRKKGIEVTQSQLDPETANNAINIYKNGVSVDTATSMYLDATNGGSDTAWSLIVPGRTRFTHFVRQAPRLDRAVDILSKNVTFTIDARWADGVKDWRRSWASKVDGATYTG